MAWLSTELAAGRSSRGLACTGGQYQYYFARVDSGAHVHRDRSVIEGGVRLPPRSLDKNLEYRKILVLAWYYLNRIDPPVIILLVSFGGMEIIEAIRTRNGR